MILCARCGNEVRWGWRPGLRAPVRPGAGFWMHREETDHIPVLGQMVTEEMRAEVDRQLDLPRTKEDGTVYTTREFDIARMKKPAREAAEEEEEIVTEPIPEPEVRSTLIEIDDERMPGGAKQIINLARKNGWTVWATYSRGPRIHASLGTLLEVSDYVVVRMRLDGGDRRAVASWCSKSGKYEFEWAWPLIADFENRRYIAPPIANFEGLKAWIRGE